MRRFLPVLGLLFLAPLVGEFLLGNLSVRVLPALPFLVPLYGGGALLIREVARRTGRGRPTILLLGAAYGVIEAGLVDQSLFNPSFEGHDFQSITPIPALGLSAASTLSFVAGHAIWSISVPIALVERGRTAPWLGWKGLTLAALLYLFGCWIIFGDLRDSEGFLATPAQRIGAATAALLLIAVAYLPNIATKRYKAPSPTKTGVIAFAASSVFFARPESWPGFWFGLAWLAAAAVWLARTRWTDRHILAIAAGTLLTYAWGGFALTALMEPHDPVRWWGNAAFAAGAIALITVTRTTSPEPASAETPTG
ncbi:hypothetical protein [Dactylosporangium sp. CS-033363]|uniref:hypothetical protein n=1 Tax=Dactylosporangium sp. CS-033363 TaxID=3239935 RepID=UPI003D924EFF